MTPNTPREFTSSPMKFLHHPGQLMAYRRGSGCTAISTHISMTAACNLSCDYCAYGNRDRTQSISLTVLQDYVRKLVTRGLRAVTLTGGGEPTLHPEFNEFVRWLDEQGLAVGLITNGTQFDRITCLDALSWARISLNVVDGQPVEVRWDRENMRPDATLGCSMIYTGQSAGVLQATVDMVARFKPDYVRIVPDWLTTLEKRMLSYRGLERKLGLLGDSPFTILRNFQRAPRCRTCHLSYFRPYLSEIDGGTVYQCCVSILSSEYLKMPESQRICAAGDVLDFLDGKIPTRIVPERDCERCTFADAVEALDAWSCNHASVHDLFV